MTARPDHGRAMLQLADHHASDGHALQQRVPEIDDLVWLPNRSALDHRQGDEPIAFPAAGPVEPIGQANNLYILMDGEQIHSLCFRVLSRDEAARGGLHQLPLIRTHMDLIPFMSIGVESWLIRSLGAGRCHAARTKRARSKSSFARP